MRIRPRPPFAAHSSFATRSTLPCLTVFHNVVTGSSFRPYFVCENSESVGIWDQGDEEHLEFVKDSVSIEELAVPTVLVSLCPRQNVIGLGRRKRDCRHCTTDVLWEEDHTESRKRCRVAFIDGI